MKKPPLGSRLWPKCPVCFEHYRRDTRFPEHLRDATTEEREKLLVRYIPCEGSGVEMG